MEGYLTIKEIAERWGITPRRVQKLCSDGMITGAIKFGNTWAIPSTTERPNDRRIKSENYINWRKHKN